MQKNAIGCRYCFRRRLDYRQLAGT